MIYFINHTEYLKIGYTSDINKRITDLQVSCPVKLTLVGLIDGDMVDESALHEKFRKFHSHGEWFTYTKELYQYVQSLDKSLLWKHGFDDNGRKSEDGLVKECRLREGITVEELSNQLKMTQRGALYLEKRCRDGSISINTLEKALSLMGYEYQHRAVKKKS